MDAWIEITQILSIAENAEVASFMGAWIEIEYTRVCTVPSSSHPSWVRGLKLLFEMIITLQSGSHPSWVRGLKLVVNGPKAGAGFVASFMGAWIEITFHFLHADHLKSRILHGAWIEISITWVISLYRKSHPSWVRGLKSRLGALSIIKNRSHPSCVD